MENRVGQAWTQNKVVVFDNEEFRVEIKPLGHFACPKCNYVVEIDKRGFAFCIKCGIIFNEPPRIVSTDKCKKNEFDKFRRELSNNRFK